jgi:hypothetical protein
MFVIEIQGMFFNLAVTFCLAAVHIQKSESSNDVEYHIGVFSTDSSQPIITPKSFEKEKECTDEIRNIMRSISPQKKSDIAMPMPIPGGLR